ncbi:phosphoenolpyruvate--protein phosphotransferase [Sphingobium sp. H39-3-25]|uniref:phosphoenolpyruvate--protein phosphotransferase n=1 Tax=Sphingobium arseniciresistens TaxID=3030834 RepID=UPI0023B93381|nr:phosphoenolpyruvate--protein phosphotransferase [Sphingobium arseniciresistens]
MSTTTTELLLPRELVRINAQASGKADAIAQAAQLLVGGGSVDPAYADSMLRREAVANTYLGSGVAIPHGMGEDRDLVRRDGIAVLQVPGGIAWNPGQTVRLIVGIAARSDSHIAILRRLTRLIQDEALLDRLASTHDADEIARALMDDSPAAASPTAPATDLPERIEWTVAYPSGLHARPAAAWVEAARAAGTALRIRHGEDIADPRSLVSLLQMGLTQGDTIVISAGGSDAPAVLARFRSVIEGLTADEKAQAERAAQKIAAARGTRGWKPASSIAPIVGVAASPGLAIGTVHSIAAADVTVPDVPVNLNEGAALLDAAITRTKLQMKALVDDTARRLGPADAAIFKAQAGLLDDTDLITLTCQLMVAGHGVAWSWNEAVDRMAGKLSALGNPVLAARAADLHDIGRRVLGQIDRSLERGSLASLPQGQSIVVAADLSPSDTAGLDPDRVSGLATTLGGPTSHTAILARTLGLPAVVAGGQPLLDVRGGTTMIVDGDAGLIYLDPGKDDLASARAWIDKLAARRQAEEAERQLPAHTRDHHEIAIGANVNRPDQVPMAIAQGGEGVGLMRTEFLFLERGDTPTEDEQYETYRAMIDALEGRPLIVRALDIGGDKQVAHLQLPHEENPFLGVRGARLLLRRPDLLDPQLRALYRAAKDGGDLSIMFPMITSISEVIALKGHCERIRAALDAPAVPLGIMIEVPAAAIQADVLAAHVDFFSIGTNDLTQYALAIDRQNPDLASEADSLHPAVLRLIAMTVKGAAAHGRWVGVCGGIAGDPFGATLLSGLGVSELSMTPRDIAAVKARLRGGRQDAFAALTAKALTMESAAAVRALDNGTDKTA